MTKTIHLGIAFDQNYVRHFFALFASILDTNRQNRIVAHCIITGLSEAEKSQIKAYAEAHGAEIRFYEIDEAFVKRFVLTSHWSAAAYYRLFFPLLVPEEEVKKLLYLDTDIIVVSDLAPLYDTPLEGFAVGAVYDNWVKNAPQLGITEEGNYFNSGMMLINVPLWKERKVSEQVFEYLAKYPERINYVDQCGLNAVLINKWKKLDWRYNVLHSRIPSAMSHKEKKAFLADKVLLHFTLDRPWKMLCRNPYRHLYHKYLGMSPFRPTEKYTDYSIKKTPHFLKIMAAELYFNMPLVKKVWRRLKRADSQAPGQLSS